jgi:hypothetical protein
MCGRSSGPHIEIMGAMLVVDWINIFLAGGMIA